MQVDARRLPLGHFVLVPTFTCNAACDHCNHKCNPQRRESAPIELFSEWITQALELGWQTICLTGGEPFTVPDHIRIAARHCLQHSARLVIQTNGYWGRNTAKAREMLATMEGITQVGFSIDKVHLSQIDLEPVLAAMEATYEAGITNVSVSVSYGNKVEYKIIKKTLLTRFPTLNITGWHILPIGRAAEHPHLTVAAPACAWQELPHGCVAQAEQSPILHPNGQLHACYRPVMALEENDPLVLGDLHHNSLSDLLANVTNRLYMFVLALGGAGLGRLLEDSRFAWLLKVNYQNECHFCHDIFTRHDVVQYLRTLLNEKAFEEYLRSGFETSCRRQGKTRE